MPSLIEVVAVAATVSVTTGSSAGFVPNCGSITHAPA
jgi:hypothetical protein